MLRRLSYAAIAASAVAVLAPAAALAADCSSISSLVALPHATVALAVQVPAGSFTAPNGQVFNGLPAFCRVAVVSTPSPDSHIGLEVWLPASGWNGRYQQAGNGMHLHFYVTKNGKNAFFKKGEYGNINEFGRFFIGGLLKHGASLSAFTNPSTNSYKRLVPGFEAPVILTYGHGNRASAIRIPKYISNPEETRFEYRPPDATANPYLCLIAMLLAGIDGVVNKIDPKKEGFGPYDKNFLEDKDHQKFHFLPRNLSEALDALAADNDFLRRGGIFTDELLDQWTRIKLDEINSIGTMPHPFEYKMYFNL